MSNPEIPEWQEFVDRANEILSSDKAEDDYVIDMAKLVLSLNRALSDQNSDFVYYTSLARSNREWLTRLRSVKQGSPDQQPEQTLSMDQESRKGSGTPSDS